MKPTSQARILEFNKLFTEHLTQVTPYYLFIHQTVVENPPPETWNERKKGDCPLFSIRYTANL